MKVMTDYEQATIKAMLTNSKSIDNLTEDQIEELLLLAIKAIKHRAVISGFRVDRETGHAIGTMYKVDTEETIIVHIDQKGKYSGSIL